MPPGTLRASQRARESEERRTHQSRTKRVKMTVFQRRPPHLSRHLDDPDLHVKKTKKHLPGIKGQAHRLLHRLRLPHQRRRRHTGRRAGAASLRHRLLRDRGRLGRGARPDRRRAHRRLGQAREAARLGARDLRLPRRRRQEVPRSGLGGALRPQVRQRGRRRVRDRLGGEGGLLHQERQVPRRGVPLSLPFLERRRRVC